MKIDKMQKTFVKEVADPKEDFAQWYTDIVKKAELVDYGPVKGTMVIRPYGYAIWELIQSELDMRFKVTGHKNAYFPMFFPLKYLQREANHIEGFAPEVALITHIGNTELAEKLVVRPTSETIICDMYSKWIKSYRDLPLLINQWANVVRWEKTTRPFLRTSEFLWQEGHTAHATEQEARRETLAMLSIYEEFCKSILAIPVLSGKKTEKEKFAGAIDTYSIEAMMQDGKSLQAGTSHYLGERFAKAFDIKFLDKDSKHKFVFQTSWGVSTRLIGALIMAHGDSRGLSLPPKVAPIQVVIITIAQHKPGVIQAAQALHDKLDDAGIRVHLDESDQSPGFKFNQWEMKGVPLRVEIGPKDLECQQATIVRRDDLENKIIKKLSDIDKSVQSLLNEIQTNMLNKAQCFRDEHIKRANSMQELECVLNQNCFALCVWCGDHQCEDKIKQQYSATSRNMPFEQKTVTQPCVCCGKKGTILVYFAKAY
ncbi:MAG: proline--tRNA ligase [Clostridiales bacterium]|jgi:prolyl-tRNA synthetase|nr:proline--tRNA ligase [Clostridiales bacterium]